VSESQKKEKKGGADPNLKATFPKNPRRGGLAEPEYLRKKQRLNMSKKEGSSIEKPKTSPPRIKERSGKECRTIAGDGFSITGRGER